MAKRKPAKKKGGFKRDTNPYDGSTVRKNGTVVNLATGFRQRPGAGNDGYMGTDALNRMRANRGFDAASYAAYIQKHPQGVQNQPNMSQPNVATYTNPQGGTSYQTITAAAAASLYAQGGAAAARLVGYTPPGSTPTAPAPTTPKQKKTMPKPPKKTMPKKKRA